MGSFANVEHGNCAAAVNAAVAAYGPLSASIVLPTGELTDCAVIPSWATKAHVYGPPGMPPDQTTPLVFQMVTAGSTAAAGQYAFAIQRKAGYPYRVIDCGVTAATSNIVPVNGRKVFYCLVNVVSDFYLYLVAVDKSWLGILTTPPPDSGMQTARTFAGNIYSSPRKPAVIR